MCPMCLATTLTLIVGGVSTASGLTAMVVKVLRPRAGGTKPPRTSGPKGETNGSSAIETRRD
jgi:hypothetical protein